MTFEKQFIKWVRIYIFGISVLMLLISIYELTSEPDDVEFKYPNWMMSTNMIISVGGLIALRRREISHYVTVLRLRFVIDFLIFLLLLGRGESLYDQIFTILTFVSFLFGPELFLLKIFQNPNKFTNE